MTTAGETVRYRVALFAAVSILCAMALPMLQGRVYTANDLGIYHLPMRQFYSQCLASGDRFEWFPNMYCGFYIHGEGQVGMYHPLHRLTYSALPLTTAFNLELLSCYVALLAGTTLLLRRWDVPRDSALFGAIIFTFAGYNLYHYLHLNTVEILAHLPWLLLALDGLLRADDPRRAVRAGVGVGLLTASQLLLGHPQSVLFSGIVEALYVLSLAPRVRSGLAKAAGTLAAKALGVLAAGVQLLPTLDAHAGSYRIEMTPSLKAMGSLPPANLIQMLAPYLYKSRVVAPATVIADKLYGDHVFGPADGLTDWRAWEFGLYNGAIVPVLLAWTLLRWNHLGGRRRLALGAAALGVLGLLIAFGDYTPLFEVTSRLPLFRMFRVPARHVVFFHLASAVLAAIAFADLAGLERRVPWRRLWPLALLPAASVAIGLGAKALARPWPRVMLRPYFAPNAGIAAGMALVGLATLLVLLAARGRRAALVGIILFAAADEAAYGLTFMRHGPPLDLAAAAGWCLPPPGPAPGRIRGFDSILTMSGARLVDGYTALEPRRVLDYRKPAPLQVAGASWMLPVRDSPDWRPVPDPLPRARLVARVVPSAAPNYDIDRIDNRTAALIEQELPLPLPGGEPGTATIVKDRPGRIDVATRAGSRQFLVLAESYHQGWRVSVDGGRARPVVRANGDFMGVVVDAGEHRLRFRFAPRSLRVGQQLSALGLALLGGGLAASFLVRPKPDPRGALAGAHVLGARGVPGRNHAVGR